MVEVTQVSFLIVSNTSLATLGSLKSMEIFKKSLHLILRQENLYKLAMSRRFWIMFVVSLVGSILLLLLLPEFVFIFVVELVLAVGLVGLLALVVFVFAFVFVFVLVEMDLPSGEVANWLDK